MAEEEEEEQEDVSQKYSLFDWPLHTRSNSAEEERQHNKLNNNDAQRSLQSKKKLYSTLPEYKPKLQYQLVHGFKLTRL